MKNITILAALLISFQVFSQSIKEGVDESKFGTVAASDFDFAGVWQANRYEVVYDRELQKVVLFEFRDSITDIVFIRTTGRKDTKQYELEPLKKNMDSLPHVTLALIDDKYSCFGVARDSSYTFGAKMMLYGADAIQFNEDVPESDRFFGNTYTDTEDLNVFWELIRYYPTQNE